MPQGDQDYAKGMMPKAETLEELMDRGEAKERRRLVETMTEKLNAAIKEAGPKGTTIDGPAHYNGYQVLEAICDAGLGRGFCLGNAVKYLLRAEKKGKDKEDLQKAQFYLNWYLEHFYDDNENTGE